MLAGDDQPVIGRRIERAGIDVDAFLDLDHVVLGRAGGETTAGDTRKSQATQVFATQPEAEVVGDVLVGHPKDVFAGLEFENLRAGQTRAAGLGVDGFAVGLFSGLEAVVDAVFGLDELTRGLGWYCPGRQRSC